MPARTTFHPARNRAARLTRVAGTGKGASRVYGTPLESDDDRHWTTSLLT